MLLVDYLEKSEAYLREKRESLHRIDEQYRRSYDPDLKKEAAIVRSQMRKKEGEISMELLLNLEEFRALKKYFPELLSVFMEDECLGRVLSKKAWLLDFKNLAPQQAAARLMQIRSARAELRDARRFLKGWIGKVQARSFAATYPSLKGHMKKDMEKDDVLELIGKVDRKLMREGWLVLITDSLIHIPLAKFMEKVKQLAYEEIKAAADMKNATGRGTVAEAKASRKLKDTTRKKEHYERVVAQILLSNPEYLKSIKKRKGWLSREKDGRLERFARGVTPRSLKERAWLNDMKKKLKVSP